MAFGIRVGLSPKETRSCAGEVDYLTNPIVDNLPLLRSDSNIAITLLDPLGWQFPHPDELACRVVR
jgi:hypothetical protein